MTRSTAIDRAVDYFDSGSFLADLTRRVAMPTESQAVDPVGELRSYLEEEMVPALGGLGCTTRIVDNPVTGRGPFLVAHRHEAERLPTVLVYGHADVVLGEEQRWRAGLDPWRVVVEETAGTGAAPRTTRASTPSTWRPWNTYCTPGADSWASTSR